MSGLGPKNRLPILGQIGGLIMIEGIIGTVVGLVLTPLAWLAKPFAVFDSVFGYNVK
ncbi:hypothetical protein FC96_GL000573 [Secundilactobacillus kimchicus JCM 15530]|uniref:Uncharacterized protein n=1 Tax=Secundilactobacillus kimchicus JCM 15530 TaxID=1302272 RepID=A0A0R1HLB7_9LACO|nr:hypothetical protein FC96_GL000573 [Secundilactobacillus kimchicus JCM 15530]